MEELSLKETIKAQALELRNSVEKMEESIDKRAALKYLTQFDGAINISIDDFDQLKTPPEVEAEFHGTETTSTPPEDLKWENPDIDETMCVDYTPDSEEFKALNEDIQGTEETTDLGTMTDSLEKE